jgi:hypothetical protein
MAWACRPVNASASTDNTMHWANVRMPGLFPHKLKMRHGSGSFCSALNTCSELPAKIQNRHVAVMPHCSVPVAELDARDSSLFRRTKIITGGNDAISSALGWNSGSSVGRRLFRHPYDALIA